MNNFQYFWSSDARKSRWLLSETKRDALLFSIVAELDSFGHSITHSVFEGNGQYQPYAVPAETVNRREEFLRQIADGKFKAQFKIGSRHGAGAALFYFLHELVHFQQDLEGRFQTETYLDLECEAAVKSICAAYRLKQVGFPMAWRGAMGSINWRAMAKDYAKNQDQEKLSDLWHKSKQPQFYSKIEKQSIGADATVISPAHLWWKFKS